MRLSWLVLVTGFAGFGCVMSTDDETQAPETATAADVPDGEDTPPSEPIDPYQKEDPPDPCKTGMPMEIAGRTVWVPVPCDKTWVDMGDPPPE
jgi:hypothetical protein